MRSLISRVIIGTYLFIGHVGVGSLLSTGIPQHRDQSAETKVVMVLFGQLLYGQRVKGEHLLGQHLQNGYRKKGQQDHVFNDYR